MVSVSGAGSAAPLLQVGESVRLEVVGRSREGAWIPLPSVLWTSLAPQVAQVDSSGLVTAFEPGMARILASAGAVEQEWTAEVTHPPPPPAPGWLDAVVRSDRRIDLVWAEVEPDVDSVRLERAGPGFPGGGDPLTWAPVAQLIPPASTFVDTLVAPGATYRYAIRSCGGHGCSNPVHSAEVTTFGTLAFPGTTLPEGVVGRWYSAGLEATGGDGTPAWTDIAGDLPPGIGLAGDGVLSGIPLEPGLFTFTARVEGGGQAVEGEAHVRIDPPPPPPVPSEAVPHPAIVGVPYAWSLRASGGDGHYLWSVDSGELPAGIGLVGDALVGVAEVAGSFDVVLRLQSAGHGVFVPLTLSVHEPLTIGDGTPWTAELGVPWDGAIPVTGGLPPFTWSVPADPLPPGVFLAPDAGLLHGTPEALGEHAFRVRVGSADGQVAEADRTLIVHPGPVHIRAGPLATGVVGDPYEAVLEASGGDGESYAWSVASGQLPPGISLVPGAGVLEGVPAAPGLYLAIVRVESGGRSAEAAIELEVREAEAAPLTVVTRAVEGGYVGIPYETMVEVSGGDGVSYAFAIVSGGLPEGLHLDVGTGVISGVPTTPGTREWTVRVESGGLAEEARFTTTISGSAPSGFNLWTHNVHPVPPEVQPRIDEALARWEEVITGNTGAAQVPASFFPPGACGGVGHLLNGLTIDDVMILVVVEPIDGPGGVLASAGPCAVMGGLPAVGLVRIDSDDLGMSGETMRDIVLHEIAHVLGFGTRWAGLGLLANPSCGGIPYRCDPASTPPPGYIGPEGIGGYHAIGGTQPAVPVENEGGPGTADMHWHRAELGMELMTGWISLSGPNPLSRATLGGMRDLGWPGVDLEAADPVFLPDAAPPAAPGAFLPLHLHEVPLDEPVPEIEGWTEH